LAIILIIAKATIKDMSKLKRKRFIAGATCPKCASTDTLMLYMENNVETVECVTCGHTQKQTDTKVEKSIRQQEGIIGVFKPE
jgi:uncharacterized metal-binding protein (TIGR02443 family)